MNRSGMIAGAEAFALTVLFVPIMRMLCKRWQLFDLPGPLKIHLKPIPRLGGVAIVIAIALAAFLSNTSLAVREWPFFLALALIWTTGLIDDVRHLSPVVRLASQVAAAAILWHEGWHLPLFGQGLLGLVAVCLYVAFFANAFNLLDGADGVASGVACIIAIGYIVLPGPAENAFALSAAWSLAGACAAFLLANFPPSKLFMGDSGSTVLGFSIAFLALDYSRSSPSAASPLTFSVLVAGLPLLDAVLAVVRRLRGRVSPLYGDRRHIYDLLLARGSSPSRVALACYGITAGLVLIGWSGVRSGSAHFSMVAVVSLSILGLVAVRLGSLRGDGENPPPIEQIRV
jgi:UDP-GlcNAc:undecaprenyl-phosphate/decaprenyl-phosphate GlcNAc-1-phosphate transferase